MHMSHKDAAYNLGADYPGGVEALAPRIGKNPNTLRAELSGTGTAKLGLDDAIKLTVMTGDKRILKAYARQCGEGTYTLPPDDLGDMSTEECIEFLGEASELFGKVSKETCADLADGKVSPNELAQWRRKKQALCHLLDKLEDAMVTKSAVDQADAQRAPGAGEGAA